MFRQLADIWFFIYAISGRSKVWPVLYFGGGCVIVINSFLFEVFRIHYCGHSLSIYFHLNIILSRF